MRKTRMQGRVTRRQFLAGLGVGALGAAVCGTSFSRSALAQVRFPKYILKASVATTRLQNNGGQSSMIWGYGGTVPGPVLRIRQGAEFSARLMNALPEATSIHWHGLRIANEMDGVVGLTQNAIEPGQVFDYHFSARDAGTYWYYAQDPQGLQKERGLYGMLIVDEHVPPQVDLDLPVILDEWHLDDLNQLVSSQYFPHQGEKKEVGQSRTVMTVNGQPYFSAMVKSGMRVRLRFLNASTESIFTPVLDDYQPTVIAIDGQPVAPFNKDWTKLSLIPGQRLDIIIDAMLPLGATSGLKIISGDYEYLCGRFVYDKTEKIREDAMKSSPALPINPLRIRLDLDQTVKSRIVIPASKGKERKTAQPKQDRKALFFEKPLITARRGQTIELECVNRSKRSIVIHCHGHHVKEVRHNKRDPDPFWRDTLILHPAETVNLAFVADNPGKWLIRIRSLGGREEYSQDWFEVLPAT